MTFIIPLVSAAVTLNVPLSPIPGTVIIRAPSSASPAPNATVNNSFYWQGYTPTTLPHNNLAGLDGGTPGQYFHFTSAEHSVILSYAYNQTTPANNSRFNETYDKFAYNQTEAAINIVGNISNFTMDNFVPYLGAIKNVNVTGFNVSAANFHLPTGGMISFRNDSLYNDSYFAYNNATARLELWVNGKIQQDWGNSTTIYGVATFEANAFFKNISGDAVVLDANLIVTGVITSNTSVKAPQMFAGNICYSDGTNCTSFNSSISNLTDLINAINQSLTAQINNLSIWAYNQTYINNSRFNETYDSFSIWAYNQTTIFNGTFNSTYDTWAYNQSELPFNIIVSMNESWLSTFNQTYAIFAHNQTYNGDTFNYTYNIWAYNQTCLTCGQTFNVTYDNFSQWAYNQSYPVIQIITSNNESWLMTYNSTYDAFIIWGYNQSTLPLQVISDMNASWLSTFNSTYDSFAIWAYNQSTAQNNSRFNETYDKFAYNQTTVLNGTQFTESSGIWSINISWLTNWLYTLFYGKTDVYNKNETYNKSEIDSFNSSWTSTFNSTYDIYAHNQTTPANNSRFNETYAMWSYNQTAPNNLVNYYHFDSNTGVASYTPDAVGNNNGLCINMGSDCTFSTGLISNSISFDGVNDHINISNVPTVNKSYNYTVVLWFNSNNVTAVTTLFTQVNHAGDIHLFSIQSGQLRTGVYNGATWTASKSSTTLLPNTWYMFAYVYYSNATSALYLDKVVQSGTTNPNGVANLGTQIGKRTDNSGYFNGTIDEVMIYNKSLSAEEVYQLYIKGNAQQTILSMNSSWLATYNSSYNTYAYNQTNKLKAYAINTSISVIAGSGSATTLIIPGFLVTQLIVTPTTSTNSYRFEANETTINNPVDRDRVQHSGIWNIQKSYSLNNTITFYIRNASINETIVVTTKYTDNYQGA